MKKINRRNISSNNFKIVRILYTVDIHRFYSCIRTGIDNPDSNLGCYATKPSDYSDFRGFFDPIIRDFHGDKSGEQKHVTDWKTSNEKYDLKECGIERVSMRVRVGRNLEDFCLPASMTKEIRIEFEKKMIKVFDALSAKYGGKYYSLSPDFGENEPNVHLISDDEYKSLVDNHIMFKDMSADPYLNSAGISRDWPFGRGCWQSEDKMRIIWVGEEDHLRIMSMKEGTDLLEVFNNLKIMLDTIEGIDGINFASHENYGYLTSCPSNLGTGMRASVHMKAPSLTSDGTDIMVKHLCEPLGLSVRGTGGEHTPIVDGIVDISPSSRLFITEGGIIDALYSGIKTIASIEDKVASNLASLESIRGKKTEGNQLKESIVQNNAAQNISDSGDEPRSDDKGDEDRDDKSTNFILVENPDRDNMEEKEEAVNIEKLKQERKLTKDSASDRSMTTQSPRSLQLSPSIILAIANE